MISELERYLDDIFLTDSQRADIVSLSVPPKGQATYNVNRQFTLPTSAHEYLSRKVDSIIESGDTIVSMSHNITQGPGSFGKAYLSAIIIVEHDDE